MTKINWGRVFVCGLLMGVVALVFGLVIIAVWGSDFETAMTALGRPFTIPRTVGPACTIVAAGLVLSTITIWLYAAIRPRYGPGPKTAAVAGFAMWLILSLADVHFMALGLIPVQELLAPLAASLVGIIAAAVAGAWAYKE